MQNNTIPLLLLGSARSGTTLFQRILNSYDEIIIWGEHDGFLQPLAESYFTLTTSPSMKEFSYPQALGSEVDIKEYKSPEQWQAWNNWFKQDDITSIYESFLRNCFASCWEQDLKYWGFKEIRYGENDKVIDLFLSINEKSKIVVIYRNPLNVIESQLSAFAGIGGRLEKLRKLIMLPKIIRMARTWRDMNQGFIKHHKKSPASVTIFSYERFTSDTRFSEQVLNNLGLSLGEEQRHVLKIKAGRGSAYSDTADSSTDNRWKRLGAIPAIAIYLITWNTYKNIQKITL